MPAIVDSHCSRGSGCSILARHLDRIQSKWDSHSTHLAQLAHLRSGDFRDAQSVPACCAIIGRKLRAIQGPIARFTEPNSKRARGKGCPMHFRVYERSFAHLLMLRLTPHAAPWAAPQ